MPCARDWRQCKPTNSPTRSPRGFSYSRCLSVLGFDEYHESHTDGLQILRYNETKAYVEHMDYLDNNPSEDYDYDSAGKGGNRFATILLYSE